MHAPPARKLKGHGVRRGVAQAPEGAPKPPAGSKTACTTARQGALRVLPKARPLGDMKLGSEFTELRGSLSAEVSGAPGLCRRAPPPGTRLPPALGSGPPSSCRRAHEELFKAASRCLRRPRGAAHPGRSLRLVLPPAISPCSRQAAISATCLQGRKKGREELLPLNTRFYSGGDDSSSLSPADQDSQLRGASLPGEVSISCHRAPGPARGGVAPRPSRRGFGDWRFLACPRQPAGGCCACGQRGHSLLPGELGRLAPPPPPGDQSWGGGRPGFSHLHAGRSQTARAHTRGHWAGPLKSSACDKDTDAGSRGGGSVSWGGRNKAPQTGGLEQQKRVLAQLCGLAVRGAGVGRRWLDREPAPGPSQLPVLLGLPQTHPPVTASPVTWPCSLCVLFSSRHLSWAGP